MRKTWKSKSQLHGLVYMKDIEMPWEAIILIEILTCLINFAMQSKNKHILVETFKINLKFY